MSEKSNVAAGLICQPRRSPKRRCPGFPDSCLSAGYGPFCPTCKDKRKRHRCGVRLQPSMLNDGRCFDCYVLTK